MNQFIELSSSNSSLGAQDDQNSLEQTNPMRRQKHDKAPIKRTYSNVSGKYKAKTYDYDNED